MDILTKIIENKKKEIEKKRAIYPIPLLEQSIYFESDTVSLKTYVQRGDKSGIIAEFKRKSPSKGMINAYADVEQVSIGYMQAGASALSVLTDETFFGGKNKDLEVARTFNYCPILRKDFIIDEYQVIEAKSIGADVILLIAECLEKEELSSLAKLAASLKMEVLLEIHSAEQLHKINEHVSLVGVNNRDLTDFSVNIRTSLDLVDLIPNDFVKISESGISDPTKVNTLKEAGFEGFLIGEYFMRSASPEKKCLQFVKSLSSVKEVNIIQQ